MTTNILFAPASLGPLLLRNRIISAPHGTCQAVDNLISEAHEAYYGTKARGGVGLIITESMRVHPTGLPYSGAIALYDERNRERLARLAQGVKQHGAALVAQLNHAGRAMKPGYSGHPLWSSSPIASPLHGEVPHAMDRRDIDELRRAFRNGASRVVEAGFDGVEVHAAHGYLLQQFLSPWANTRSDEYGGSIENRRRLLLEILEEVRSVVPRDRVLGVRISSEEWVEGGLHTEDMEQVAQELGRRRLVDYIHVSSSTYHPDSYWTMIPDMHEGMAPFADRIGRIKSAVSNMGVRVIGVGRIHDAAIAETLVENGTLDFVAMARQLIADPEWPNKVREGRLDEIRPCIACNQGCIGVVAQHQPIRCVVNPTAGRERSWDPEIFQQGEALKVVVVGGGVAGLEAARVAAAQGQRVVLFERSAHLGGQARTATLAPGRGEFSRLLTYLETDARRRGAEIRLSIEATPEAITAEAPDAVVVACGARHHVEPIMFGRPAIDAVEALNRVRDDPAAFAGRHILLVDDAGHYQSYGTAEALAAAGAAITLVTSKPSIGAKLPTVNLHRMLKRLKASGVRCFDGSTLVAGGEGVSVRDVASGSLTALSGVDLVVVSGAPSPSDDLVAWARENFDDVHVVGDCASPRSALEAMHDGHRVARGFVTPVV